MKEVLDTWHDEWKDFLKEKTYNPETNRGFTPTSDCAALTAVSPEICHALYLSEISGT